MYLEHGLRPTKCIVTSTSIVEPIQERKGTEEDREVILEFWGITGAFP